MTPYASLSVSTTNYTVNSVNQYSAITGALADTPTYDATGNTTGLNGKVLRYDEENRLVQVTDLARTVTYIYDGLGRRVERLDSGGTTPVIRYVYDSRRVIEETDQAGITLRSYTRGLDLSGSLEKAGGIGGLLAMAIPSGSTWAAATYVHDGNGNVTDLINDNGTIAAHYTYTPFGDRLTAAGTLADINPYQFSAKEHDSFTGQYYFGLRYYNPITGRWLNRDPIEENGGVNLYGFIENDAVNGLDYLGLFDSVPWNNVHGNIINTGLTDTFSGLHIVRIVSGSNALDFSDWLKYETGKNNPEPSYDMRNHFDSIRTPEQLQANWAEIDRRMRALAKKIAAAFCSQGSRAKVDGLLFDYGAGILHAVDDFYAHSNMVERHAGELYDPHNPDHQDVTSGMTYKQAQYDPSQLHGGSSPTDPGMNHDSPGRPNFELARWTAIEATKQNWDQMQQLITEEHARLKASGKCCGEMKDLLKWFTGR